MTENSFILGSRLRIFNTILAMNPENITSVILGSCLLQKFLLKSCKSKNILTLSVHLGDCRQNVSNNIVTLIKNHSRNVPTEAESREPYCQYFNGLGKLRWHDEIMKINFINKV